MILKRQHSSIIKKRGISLSIKEDISQFDLLKKQVSFMTSTKKNVQISQLRLGDYNQEESLRRVIKYESNKNETKRQQQYGYGSRRLINTQRINENRMFGLVKENDGDNKYLQIIESQTREIQQLKDICKNQKNYNESIEHQLKQVLQKNRQLQIQAQNLKKTINDNHLKQKIYNQAHQEQLPPKNKILSRQNSKHSIIQPNPIQQIQAKLNRILREIKN